jgi:AraC-like DNA-binding protein
MSFKWTEIIALFTLIQLLFLTIVNFNYKKGKRVSSLLLSGFMASNALLIAHFLLSQLHLITSEKYIVLHSFGKNSYLLLMPFLYLYIYSLCYKDFKLKRAHLLHALPYFITALFCLFVNLVIQKTMPADVFLPWQQGMIKIEFWSYKIILHLQIISYLIAATVMLSNYRRRLKDLYSSIERIDLSWCNILLVGFAAMWFLDLVAWILRTSQALPGWILYWMFIFSLLINLTFTLAITYKGLVQSATFSGIQALPKYAASRLKFSDCEAIVQKLTSYMKKEKPYLTSSLSVNNLTKKLNLPAKHLSQAIHSCLNQNFYDLINAYRIAEAKERLDDERFNNQTLLSIAYDLGFNSKSVFNAAFKKHTGMTPKEYKRRRYAT